MVWFKVFLSNIGCMDHLASSCGASKFMGFEDILVVPVGEFSFTSPTNESNPKFSYTFAKTPPNVLILYPNYIWNVVSPFLS